MSCFRTFAAVAAMFSLVACDDGDTRVSYKKQQEQKHEKAQQARESRIAAAEQLFNAKRFPPVGFKTHNYTYIIQRYFEEHKERAHLFEGSVVDIAKTTTGYRANIQAAYGNFLRNEVLLLDLSVPESILPKLVPHQMDSVFLELGSVGGKWIVARIADAGARIQRRISVSGDREYVSSRLSMIRHITLKGDLIDFSAKEKQNQHARSPMGTLLE